MNCPSCGRQQDPSNKYCDICGTLISRDEEAVSPVAMFEQPSPPDTGIAEASYTSFSGHPEAAFTAERPVVSRQLSPAPGITAAGKPLSFRLAHGEQVLKEYDVVTLRTGLFKRQRGHGTLYVTDARVVFYAQVYPRGTQKASWIFQQTKLQDISGLFASVSRRLSLGLVVLTLAFALLTIGTLLTVVLIPLAVVFAIVTVLLVIGLVRDSSRRGDVGVVINSRENENSPIAFGHLPRQRGFLDSLGRLLIFPIALFLRSYTAFDVIAGDPGDDAGELLHELGALIIDLQTRGTMAYPEWNILVPVGAVGAATAQ
jgi:hypothetical protein